MVIINVSDPWLPIACTRDVDTWKDDIWLGSHPAGVGSSSSGATTRGCVAIIDVSIWGNILAFAASFRYIGGTSYGIGGHSCGGGRATALTSAGAGAITVGRCSFQPNAWHYVASAASGSANV